MDGRYTAREASRSSCSRVMFCSNAASSWSSGQDRVHTAGVTQLVSRTWYGLDGTCGMVRHGGAAYTILAALSSGAPRLLELRVRCIVNLLVLVLHV